MAEDDNPGRVPEVYANGVRFAISAFDFTLQFEVQDLDKMDPSLPQVIGAPSLAVARVRVSPQLALVLGKIIAKGVEDYEKQFGKIPAQADLLQKMGLK